MAKLVAINEVEYVNEKGKRQYAKPGHMFNIADESVAEKLKGIKAAREPNKAELALEAMQAKPAPKAPQKPSTTTTGGANGGGAAGGANGGGAAGGANGGGAKGDDVI